MLVTVVAAITLLPALFGIVKFRIYRRGSRVEDRLRASASRSLTAARLARVVGAPPLPWLIGSLVLLFALAAPGSANWYLPVWLDRILPRPRPHQADMPVHVPMPAPQLSSVD